MDNELLVSVIMPVYNGEKTVGRAIESVLCQMDGRIELILVDDGSKDSSGVICDEYADKYPNIHVIHKENGGISTARNAGIRAARGLYLSFLDCDDTVEPTTYSEVIPILIAQAPDCLDFGFHYVDVQGTRSPTAHKLPKNELLSLSVLNETILPPLLNLRKDDDHFVFDFSCLRIYKAAIIREHNVYFDETRRIWEDRSFVLHYLNYCQNYYSMSQHFYNYYFTPSSLSQRYSLDFFRIILSSFHKNRVLYQDRFDFETQYAYNHWSNAIENMIFRSLEQTENQDQIHQNILNTLHDETVVHWFANRKCASGFAQAASALIAAGDCEAALHIYEKEHHRRQRANRRNTFSARIKRTIKRLIGR